MEKLKMHSPDITQQNIDKLLELFPNCKTEKQEDDGEMRVGVDFDLLKQELSKNIVEGPKERYQLNWPGKKEALLIANAPIAKTLRPCREESVDFDSTENLFIEGDNLDALKLLQETYLGKVKMIYIDPPYNTGKDFIYADDFAESADEYMQESGQKDERGNRLIANTDSNGRFHSDWLSMMYSRLKLARNLLKDDGVVFISIDNNEVTNIAKVCEEIFGSDNFISSIANINNPKGRSDDKYVATAHEYVLMYARNLELFNALGFEPGPEILKRYNKLDSTGDKYREIDLRKTGDTDLREDRPNLFYYFHYNEDTKELIPTRDEIAPSGFKSIKPLRKDGREGNWRWGLDTSSKNIHKLGAKYMPNREIWGVYEKDMLKDRGLVKATSAWTFKDVNSERGSEEFINLGFDKRLFPKPKPIGTIKRTLQVALSGGEPEIILDFFAGSSSTAHAVMKINAEDNGNRKFIMVQLPEECDKNSEAFKAGYSTIAEISKERIRRAGTKIKEETTEATGLDTGFRVLKIDSSNMNEVHYMPDTVSKGDLLDQIEHIKKDRTAEDLLFQVMLDWGVDFSLPIRIETIEGKEVYFVNDDDLVACFDKGIDEVLIKALAAKQPLRVVFRDDGFVSDSLKINVKQIFKQLAPATDIKAI